MEKFFPSGQAFVVPLQNFAISPKVTSFTLLLAEVTIAIFLNAASAETAHAAITQAIASDLYNFAEILACMDHFSFQKEYKKYSFLCRSRQVTVTHSLQLYRIRYSSVRNAHTCTSDQLFCIAAARYCHSRNTFTFHF